MAELQVNVTIIDLFKRRVADVPEETALILESGEKLSYTALDSLAQSIGSCVLEQLGSSASSTSDTPLVCIMLERHAALIASMLGVLMAGAAYVPVDPAFPADRQAYIFEHSQCKLLIADESCYASALSFGISLPPVIVVSPKGRVIKSPSTPSVENRATRLHSVQRMCYQRHNGGLMYVMYTSGSTGKPKGVMVSQFGVTNIVSWFVRELGVRQGHRVLGLTTACFDISVLEIYMPLISGATLVLADSASQKDPFRLLEVMRQFGVTVFQATPTTYEMMLATGWRGDRSVDFLVGGEAFRPSLVPLASECRSFRNVYGPTETTIWSSSFELTPAYFQSLAPGTAPVVPVGRPISQTDFYLIDAEAADARGEFRRVSAAAGEEGELCIGGAGVAAGYLHAPDLTAARFIPNPFGEGTIYRTGDLVKMLGSGDYLFVRRLDDQVKVDGYRIELAEIETVYERHALVEQAVVLVRRGKLAAYLRLRGGRREASAEELAELREFASRSLTHYMLPAFTSVVAAFPQTANGKLDRKALPDPVIEEAPLPLSSVSAAQEVEWPAEERTMLGHVLRLFRDLRGVRPRPGATFASVGVDSLGAVLFIRALSDSLGGLQISPAKMYRSGVTIRAFCDELFERVLAERPEVVRRLGLEPSGRGDVESQAGAANGDGTAEERVAEEYEGCFSALLSSNIRLTQGIRGAYAALVLWDHYHDHTKPALAPHIMLADASLFVILTGLTTAFQLREPLSVSVAVGRRRRVAERRAFDWRNFLFSRAVGILPILWLAYLVYAPQWYLENHVTEPPPPAARVVATCAALYVFGMSSYDHIECDKSGPNVGIYYGSLILNVFIIFSFFRVFFVRFQNFIIRSYNAQEKQTSGVLSSLIDIMRCEPKGVIAGVFYFGSFLLFGLLMLISEGLCTADLKDGLAFVWYLLGGTVLASVLETLYKAHLHPFSATPVVAEEEQERGTGEKGDAPAVSAAAGRGVWATVYAGARRALLLGLVDADEGAQPVAEVGPQPFESSLLWRFLPDILFVINGIILAGQGRLKETAQASFFRWLGVQVTSSLFILVSYLQRGSARRNVSRFLLETPFMNVVGRASYVMYLLQTTAFQFYAPVLRDDVDHHTFPIDRQYASEYVRNQWEPAWFQSQSLGLRVAAFLILVVISWLIQVYYQDRLVASLVAYVMAGRGRGASPSHPLDQPPHYGYQQPPLHSPPQQQQSQVDEFRVHISALDAGLPQPPASSKQQAPLTAPPATRPRSKSPPANLS